MMKMTKKEAITNHRKMWNWIADKTLELERKVKKEGYFDYFNIPEYARPFCDCYCCEYDFFKGNGNCNYCPIDMRSNDSFVCKKIYKEWTMENNYIKSAELARQIAELPEREDVE